MTKRAVRQLHPGDEVYWNDPDEGKCSRSIIIAEITINGDIIRITDRDGDTVECFASELS